VKSINNWKNQCQLKKEVKWISNLTIRWKFLPGTHETPPWRGIPPRLGTTDLNGQNLQKIEIVLLFGNCRILLSPDTNDQEPCYLTSGSDLRLQYMLNDGKIEQWNLYPKYPIQLFSPRILVTRIKISCGPLLYLSSSYKTKGRIPTWSPGVIRFKQTDRSK